MEKVINHPMYLIDRYGNVFSLKRNKYLKHCVENHGYPVVRMDSKSFLLHRLLAIQFIPNNENKPFVNHIDSDKLNFNLSNLEWCTHIENMQHCAFSGRRNMLKISKMSVYRSYSLDNIETVLFLYSKGFSYSQIMLLIPITQSYFYKITKRKISA